MRKGASLIELIILFVIISILVIFLFSMLQSPDSRASHAVENAKAFSSSMGWKIKGLACSGLDSDHDGYVTCTLNLVSSEGKEEEKSIQCGYPKPLSIFDNNGCKLSNPINLIQ